MAIRTKEYRFTAGGNRRVRGIRITEKNLIEIVNYIVRNGGEAVASSYVTPSGDVVNHKIRIKQVNYGKLGKAKRDWRVARPGDFIVKHENGAFERVKDDEFEAKFVLSK